MKMSLALITLTSLMACKVAEQKNQNLRPTETQEPEVVLTKELSCTAQSNPLRFSAYNVENLHDTRHDEGKNDWEFLPKDYPGRAEYCAKETNPTFREQCEQADWTEEKLALKLEQIKKVMSEMGPELPHFLALTEIENEVVTSQLAKVLGYEKLATTSSPDERGIDVGLLWNETNGVRFVSKQEHDVADPKNPTRNILEVIFELHCGRRLAVFVNHWPSQRNPSSSRILAAKTLQRAIDEVLAKNSQTYILSLGDFNVVSKDRPDAFYEVLQSQLWKSALLDLDTIARPILQKQNFAAFQKLPYGSYFFAPNMEWNVLDRAFLSKNIFNKVGLEVNPLSYRIVSSPFMTRTHTYDEKSPVPGSAINQVPLRYNFKATTAETAGHSDHFPIYFELKEVALE
jgi:hypothetical protein